jgi:peptide/nickel transport system substrate-binding protein
MADRTGQQLGNYRLIRLLGQGGFADVYLGEHTFLSTQAAIKLLHTRLTGDELQGFHNEARTIAHLIHPNIVRVLEYGVESGVPYLVMDYAPGGTLRERHPKGSILPLSVIVSYVRQVASALQYAHTQKLIHRDVKPENMLIGRNNEVLLSDFGVALIAQSSLSQSVHEVAGTVTYMAPEQIRGKPRFASDQYALAVVMYEWLCGERPFQGSFTEVAAQHALAPPPPLHDKMPAISPYIEQVIMTALEKDPNRRFASVQSFANAFEQACQTAPRPGWTIPQGDIYSPGVKDPTPSEKRQQDGPPVVSTPPYQPQPPQQDFVYTALATPAGRAPVTATPENWAGTKISDRARKRSPLLVSVLIGLAIMVILAGSGLLYYVSRITQSPGGGATPTSAPVVSGGTWSDDLFQAPDSLIPNAGFASSSAIIDQALWAPLFYADSQGNIQPGLATEIPTIANNGVSSDLKTWTFHLRPNLKWSDGQPLNADDVVFTWKLWISPQFTAASTVGISQITSADVSANKLTITFHLNQPFAPFLAAWIDGMNAPMPAHHYSGMAPGAIVTSSENLSPPVTSGPFRISQSQAGLYTLIRNANYYLASQGLPHLDSINFHIVKDQASTLADLQAGTLDSAWFLDVSKTISYQQLSNYVLETSAASANFEALYFNFRNPVLGKYPEVRQAIAMAIDQQNLIDAARRGQAAPLCTDHGTAYHPGYEANAPCPKFDPNAANALLDQNGWTPGSDGVRTKNGTRLEFEYSSSYSADTNSLWRADDELIVQANLKAIGIQIDIQNYPPATFFGTFLTGAKPSPATGAKAGSYDIAEYENVLYFDPDDSAYFSCNQFPPAGANYSYYCNPALDALYNQERTTLDPSARQQIFNAIHKIYLTDSPFIVLYSPLDISVHKKTVHNYAPGPYGALEGTNIWEWWCANGKC